MAFTDALRSYRAGGVAFGTWAQINHWEICELQARSGLQFVCIDMEHGCIGIEAVAQLIRAVDSFGVAPMVRIPPGAIELLPRLLEFGAVGFFLPMVDGPAQLRQAINLTRFAPEGNRGSCPFIRANAFGLGNWAETVARPAPLIIAIIETLSGVKAFDSILAVEGLDAVGVGQFDLAQAMGFPGMDAHPEVLAQQEVLFAKALAAGKDIFTATFASETSGLAAEVERLRSLGSRLIAISGDRMALMNTYRAIRSSISEFL